MNESKKIEPTAAMVDEAANILCLDATGTSLRFHADVAKRTYRNKARPALRAALNHPDAAGLFGFAFVDALRAAREQGWDQAVDWIRGDQGGPSGRTTNARLANPYRPAQELPTEDGAVIVPADGYEHIGAEGVRLFARLTYSGQLGLWYGVVVNGGPAWAAVWYGGPEKIAPGTWKVDTK